MNRINEQFAVLSSRYNVPVRLVAVDDPNAPTQGIREEDGTFVITLNAAKIPAGEYANYAGYNVRQVLLPRLVLETERLILRRYQPEDAAGCFALLSDEEGAYMDCCKAIHSMDEEFYERMALFAQRETQYMITGKDTGEVVGIVNVFADDSRAADSMEIGYGISPAHRRRGYAFEALSALLELLQRELRLELVTAGILEENVASMGLLEKLGFQREGLRHKAVWHEGLGRPVDLIYYYRDR